MTANTPTWGLTYPLSSDPPNVPLHMRTLAEDVDLDLTSLDARIDTLEAPTPIGGGYRSTTQTFPAWAANKLNFPTTLRAANGITWNGTNQFTVVSAGTYSVSAFVSFPFASGNNCLLGIGKSSIGGAGNPGDMWTGWTSSGQGGTDISVSNGSVYLGVGDTICAWMYINGGSAGAPLPPNIDANSTEFHVYRVK